MDEIKMTYEELLAEVKSLRSQLKCCTTCGGEAFPCQFCYKWACWEHGFSKHDGGEGVDNFDEMCDECCEKMKKDAGA